MNHTLRTKWRIIVISWLLMLACAIIATQVSAQDCSMIIELESRTVKAGESVAYTGAGITNPPGKQFIVDNGGQVTLQSAKRIELNNGFKSLNGSLLSATVAPCNPDNQPPKDQAVVFPNPTDGIINVKAPYQVSGARISDMDGTLQATRTDINDTSFSMDISKSKPGYYILEIIAGRTVTETIRIEKK